MRELSKAKENYKCNRERIPMLIKRTLEREREKSETIP